MYSLDVYEHFFVHFALFTGTSCPLSSSFNLDPGQPRTVFPLDSSGKHILLTGTLERRTLSGQDSNLIIFLLFCLRRRVPGHRGPPAPTEVRVRFPGAGRG